MSIDDKHKDYEKYVSVWDKIDDICDGENLDKYLIELNKDDTSSYNVERNRVYRERAVFYRVAGNTSDGMLGISFSKPPSIEVPSEMEYVKLNASGSGETITQLAKKTLDDINRKSRAGVYTSFPRTEREVTQEDLNSGRIFSTISHIEPQNIINWEEILDGSVMKLSKVVLAEKVFEGSKEIDQRRELFLDGGVFKVQLWRKAEKKDGITEDWERHDDEVIQIDGSGQPWTEITFSFVGSKTNTPDVNKPSYSGMVDINIGHFRNSADWEESIWYAGQLQPWMSGVTEEHLNLMTKHKMRVGSGQLIAVPSGEKYGIEQGSANPVVRQAMIDKLDMMIAIGARIIDRNSPNKTATESNSDDVIQHSELARNVMNVSAVYTKALKWAARNMKASDDVVFELPTDFISPNATAQDIQAMVAGFMQGAIPSSDYFNWMKRVGLVDGEKTMEAFNDEIGLVSMPNLDVE